jgi:hypothetical protein
MEAEMEWNVNAVREHLLSGRRCGETVQNGEALLKEMGPDGRRALREVAATSGEKKLRTRALGLLASDRFEKDESAVVLVASARAGADRDRITALRALVSLDPREHASVLVEVLEDPSAPPAVALAALDLAVRTLAMPVDVRPVRELLLRAGADPAGSSIAALEELALQHRPEE